MKSLAERPKNLLSLEPLPIGSFSVVSDAATMVFTDSPHFAAECVELGTSVLTLGDIPLEPSSDSRKGFDLTEEQIDAELLTGLFDSVAKGKMNPARVPVDGACFDDLIERLDAAMGK